MHSNNEYRDDITGAEDSESCNNWTSRIGCLSIIILLGFILLQLYT